MFVAFQAEQHPAQLVNELLSLHSRPESKDARFPGVFGDGEGWSEDEWRLPLILSSKDNAGFSSTAGPSPWSVQTLVSKQPHALSHSGSVTLPPLTLSSRASGLKEVRELLCKNGVSTSAQAHFQTNDCWADE